VLDLWTDLIGCLDLHIEHARSEADNVSVFEGVSQQLDYHRVFGGQLLGQFIRAASLACPDKTVKSLHAVFGREGRAGEPVCYRATRQHEGRSFASLTITAQQPHAVLASSSVSLHAVEDGPENQDCQAVPALLDETHRVELDLIPWETRSAEDLNALTAGPPRFEVWMRTPPVDDELATALAAYATEHRPLASTASAQSGAGARPLLWPRRRSHRRRHARRVLRPGSAAALSRRHRPMTQKRSHIAPNEQFGEPYSRI